jgi:hypothetical protein
MTYVKMIASTKRASLAIILQIGLVCSFSLLAAAEPLSYNLTKDDVEFLKRISAKDQLIKALPDGVKGLEALNKVFGAIATGTPIRIAVEWNKGTIAAWRTANQRLEKIGKATICKEIDLYIVENDDNPKFNKDFFERLYEARGCKE